MATTNPNTNTNTTRRSHHKHQPTITNPHAAHDAAFVATLPAWARTYRAVVAYAQAHPDYAEELRAADAAGERAWRRHLLDEAYRARVSADEDADEEADEEADDARNWQEGAEAERAAWERLEDAREKEGRLDDEDADDDGDEWGWAITPQGRAALDNSR